MRGSETETGMINSLTSRIIVQITSTIACQLRTLVEVRRTILIGSASIREVSSHAREKMDRSACICRILPVGAPLLSRPRIKNELEGLNHIIPVLMFLLTPNGYRIPKKVW